MRFLLSIALLVSLCLQLNARSISPTWTTNPIPKECIQYLPDIEDITGKGTTIAKAKKRGLGYRQLGQLQGCNTVCSCAYQFGRCPCNLVTVCPPGINPPPVLPPVTPPPVQQCIPTGSPCSVFNSNCCSGANMCSSNRCVD